MLYVSLVLSGILVVVAFLAARYARQPVTATVVAAAGVIFLPVLIFSFFPAAALQAAVLGGGVLLAALFGRGRRAIAPLAVVSLLVGYGVAGWSAAKRERGYDWLRAAHPMASMEARLPRPVPASAPGDPDRLARLEKGIDAPSRTGRVSELRLLHRESVNRFVNSSGFGVMRMTWEPSERELRADPREAPDQPDYFRPGGPALARDPTPRDAPAFNRLHEAGVLDFVNPGGFGYVKDRRNVAGFLSHGFSKVPNTEPEWKVARLELVGLLRHENPVVYLSEKLPQMDQLKDAPTRPLDAFEEKGLAALRGGEDLYLGEGDDAGRFLGAVRSAKQCAECHGGERGALLGAFSYRMQTWSGR